MLTKVVLKYSLVMSGKTPSDKEMEIVFRAVQKMISVKLGRAGEYLEILNDSRAYSYSR